MIRLHLSEIKAIMDEFNDPNLRESKNTYANGDILEVLR